MENSFFEDNDDTYEGKSIRSDDFESAGVELNVDQSYLLSLLRRLLEAPVQTEPEVEAIEAACVLWDTSNSLTIAEYLCANSLFLVSEKILNEQHSPRLSEAVCGILGNTASVSPSLCHLLGCEDGLATTVIGLLFTSCDPPTLSEALRVITAGCSLTTPAWRARFDCEVCARAMSLLSNALNSQLQRRLCEFFYALIYYVDETEEAKNDLIAILKPSALLECVCNIIVLSANFSSVAFSPSDEVLDLCLKVFCSLVTLDPRCLLPTDLFPSLYRVVAHTANENCKMSACGVLACYLVDETVRIPQRHFFVLWDCVCLFAAELSREIALRILHHILLSVLQDSSSFTSSSLALPSNADSSSNGISQNLALPMWFTKFIHSVVKGTNVISILCHETPAGLEVTRLLMSLLDLPIVIDHCAQSNRSKRLATLATSLHTIAKDLTT